MCQQDTTTVSFYFEDSCKILCTFEQVSSLLQFQPQITGCKEMRQGVVGGDDQV